MFDRISLLWRERSETPKRGRKLRSPQLVHLLAKLPHDRYRRQTRDPVPVLLHLFSDDFARGWHVFTALLEIGRSRGAQVIEIIEESVFDLTDGSLDIAWKSNV